MQVWQLRAFDLFCLHIYLVLLLQLFANWGNYNCGYNMTAVLLTLYMVYVARIVIVQIKRVSFSYETSSET